MNHEFLQAIKDIEKEKGVSAEQIINALESALTSAYKKNFNSSANANVIINRETGEIKIYSRRTVVEKSQDDRNEISYEDAQKISAKYEMDDIVETEVNASSFGRIAAQTAKQVTVQKIKEAERELVYNEYKNRINDIITGVVQRYEQKSVIIDLGKTEAILEQKEQMPGEVYPIGDRIKVFIVDVKDTSKGPKILLSRTHPGLLKRLFELEVPEIFEGIVEIKSVAREAGHRSKIAVYSRDENVDPVGACVGQKGLRVQAIVNEIKGEKIDIVKWDEDNAVYIANSLSPAKVMLVEVNEDDKMSRVVVPDYQLSLAIGKEGQNARLAAKLTNWKIDIKSQSQAGDLLAEYGEDYEED